jgi:glycosyltransferase involved in cell wall biosynthesis
MKIAEVSHVFLPNIGGIEFYVSRLSRDMSRAGENICVVTSDMGVDKKENPGQGYDIKYFHAVPIILRNPFPPGMILHFLKNKYDIIHIHSIHAFPAFIAMALKGKAKTVITVHGVSPEKPGILLRYVWRSYLPAAKLLCKKADRIIVLGQKEKEKLIGLLGVSPEKIEVIPNGIDDLQAPVEGEAERLRSKYGLKGCRIILYSGRVQPTKNPEILIESFSKARQEFKDIKLLMIGPIEEKYKASLVKLAEKNNSLDDIIFTGIVSKEELYAAYNIADMFVSLGGWEGIPTTMLEAMYFSVPCILYDAGGIKDAIKDGANGFVLDRLDSDETAKRMAILLRDEEKRKNFGKKCRDIVLDNFMWEKCFNKIYDIYAVLSMI